MNFLEYIDQSIADMLADIKGQQEAIAALEGAREFYRMYLEDFPQATETPKEAPPVPVVTEVPAAPVKLAAAPEDTQETDKATPSNSPPNGQSEVVKVSLPTGDRRRKEFWTPERKAEASRLAKENHAKRKKLPPVEERPRANFRKAVIPAHTPAAIEAKPAWADQPREKSDIVNLDDCPLSLAGAVLFDKGKYISHLDKEQKGVMERLITNFPEQTLIVEIKDLTRNIDRTVSELRGILGLTEAKIESTNGGWKLVAVMKEVV